MASIDFGLGGTIQTELILDLMLSFLQEGNCHAVIV